MVAAGGFDLRAERDAPLVVEAAPGGKPASGDPVDDGAVADAEPAGDLGDGDLAVIEKPRLRDLVVVAQRGDRVVVERPAGTGDVAGGVEPFGNVVVGEVGKTAGEIDGRGVSASILGDVLAPGDHELVGGAGVPADPDAGLGEVRLGEQRDIGDEGAQEPFAVPGRGGGPGPQG